MAAEFAVERWEDLGTLTPGERLESIRSASEEVSRPAAEKGDLVHDIIDSWMSGRPRDDDPGQVNSYMNSFIRFLTDTRAAVYRERGLSFLACLRLLRDGGLYRGTGREDRTG